MSGPTPATVELVTARDGWLCVRCGRNVKGSQRGVGWSLQHRKPRSMGGTSERACPWINSPENLVLLCGSATTGCHGDVESERFEALKMGYSIHRNSIHLPADVPVYVFTVRAFVYLTSDGDYSQLQEKQ
jgi:hypothetical protein